MKVHELITLLQEQNQDADVLMSDDDSNYYLHIDANHNVGVYKDAEGTTTFGYKELTAELKDLGYTAKDLIPDGQPCIVLYPIMP